MKKRSRAWLGNLVIAFSIFLIPQVAYAVPPPDILFNLWAQLAYVFSAVALFFSATWSILYQYLKHHVKRIKLQWPIWLGGTIALITLAFGLSYGYTLNKLKNEDLAWQVKSAIQNLYRDPHQEATPPPDLPLDEKIYITEARLNEILMNESKESYVILDAREDLENEYGQLPGSIHIRPADLKAGAWESLPDDKPIYVICWSGMRGQEVTKYLRSQGLDAFYLQTGAGEWVENGGDWEGEIHFSEAFPGKQYEKTLSTVEVHTYVSTGAILVDVRPPWKFHEKKLEGSYSLPLLETPSEYLESYWGEIPESQDEVIAICDDYTTCFIAKLVGVELERRGYTFLGRYTSPWEY